MKMRREIRYRLEASALFSWESPQHERLQGDGITRDISVFGVFILTRSCPPVETPVEFEIVLPSLTGLMPAIRIKGEARVLRIERRGGGRVENGFAVLSEDFTQMGPDSESGRIWTQNREALNGARAEWW